MSHVKPGSTWKGLVSGTAVKPASTWKNVVEIWHNVSGVWKLGWAARSFTLKADGVWLHQSNSAPTYSEFRFNTDGTCDARGPGSGTYAYEFDYESSGDATDLYIRVADNAANLSGDAEGSFIALSSAREWYVFDNDSGIPSVTGNVDIDIARDAGGSDIVATVNWTPNAQYLI